MLTDVSAKTMLTKPFMVQTIRQAIGGSLGRGAFPARMCGKVSAPLNIGGETRRNGMAGVGEAGGKRAEKLGYLGRGMMGFPMARRLVNAGYDVTVWNRSSGKAAALVEAGAKLAPQPRDVAATASILFICLTDAAAVEEVVFGPDGLAAATGAGKLVVDFSSIHPDAARAIAERLKLANGMGWIDAPVSGGTIGLE